MLVSKVTAKAQTTLPSGVRDALGVRPGDRLGYQIEGDRAVIRKVEDEGQDEALAPFLALLEHDIVRNPRRLKAVPRALLERIRALTKGVRVPRDQAISGPVAL